MKTVSWIAFASLAPLLVISAQAAPNENRRVHIYYRQALNFQTYLMPPSFLFSASMMGSIYVMYRIEKIANDGPQAISFLFKRRDVVPVGHTTGGDESTAESLLGDQVMPDNKPFPKGPPVTAGLGCIIKIVNGPFHNLAQVSALFDLRYKRSNSQPVTMDRIGDNSPATIMGDATAHELRNYCY
jgi:hypothetical protein